MKIKALVFVLILSLTGACGKNGRSPSDGSVDGNRFAAPEGDQFVFLGDQHEAVPFGWSDEFDRREDGEYYQLAVTLHANQEYIFEITDAQDGGEDTFLYLLDDSENIVAQDDNGADGRLSRLTYTSSTTALYHLRLRAFSRGSSGTCTLRISAPASSLSEVKIPLPLEAEPPSRLSQTGLFTDPVNNLEAVPELRPYEVNQPLWTDQAVKKRWLYTPANSKIEFDVDEPWSFPIGTVLVKHFQMEVSREKYRNIETRILVHKLDDQQQGSWVGYTYQWNEDDAVLVADGKSPMVTMEIDASAAGGARTQEFQIPSRGQCLQCHNAGAGDVRGVRTFQVNRLVNGENLLQKWNEVGLFTENIADSEPATGFPALTALEDENADLEARVRAYLSVNCAHCHNPEPEALGHFINLDLRYNHWNKEKLVNGYLIRPGEPATSEIYRRMLSERTGERMPLLGSRIKHAEALAVLERWIRSLESSF